MLSKFKKIASIAFLFLTLLSCSESYEDSETKIIGHAGMGISDVYPWNSYESVSKAMHLPSDGVEIDLQLSSDEVWFAYHSSDLSSETDIQGAVHDMHSGIVEKAVYDLPLYSNYYVAKVDDILEDHSGFTDKEIIFDVKMFAGLSTDAELEKLANQLIGLIEDHEIEEQVIVELKSLKLAQIFHQLAPDIRIFAASYSIEEGALWLDSVPITGVVGDIRYLNRDRVEAVQEKGLEVLVYNAMSKDDNDKAFELEVDYLLTDQMDYALSVTERDE